MGISPATVRNVMVDLEEAGLLEQPHTSAGRVPTDRGYRVFVDRLMVRETPTREEIVLLRTELGDPRQTVEGLLERTSRALGKAAAQLGIAISPKVREGILVRVEASPLASGRVLFSFVFASGAVRTIHARMEGEESGSSISEALSWVNRKIDGLELRALSRLLEREMASDVLPSDWRGVFRVLGEAVGSLMGVEESEQVHFGGTANIMAQPEFSDPERLRPIVAMMERSDLLIRSLPSRSKEEAGSARVIIGTENRWRPMRHCSLVISSYQSGPARGSIGVIGPTRMPYPKLVPLVERTAQLISSSLDTI
jgi:heat-inducible transcriptional repressor